MAKTRKAINFDLDTNLLREHYGEPYNPAYDEIKRFMLKSGFEHRQGSGYVSKKPMSSYTAVTIVQSLSSNFEWFEKCVKVCDLTEVKKIYDLKPMLKQDSVLINNDGLKIGLNDIIKNSPPKEDKTISSKAKDKEK